MIKKHRQQTGFVRQKILLSETFANPC